REIDDRPRLAGAVDLHDRLDRALHLGLEQPERPRGVSMPLTELRRWDQRIVGVREVEVREAVLGFAAHAGGSWGAQYRLKCGCVTEKVAAGFVGAAGRRNRFGGGLGAALQAATPARPAANPRDRRARRSFGGRVGRGILRAETPAVEGASRGLV